MPWRDALKQSQCLTGLVNALRALPGDARRLRARLRRSGQIRRHFAAHPVRCLQIGCGHQRLAGWLNSDYQPRHGDVMFLDATRRFPFPDASLDFIFSEHMIEHVPYPAGQVMLRECHRVLKPGGCLRLSTPNLVNIASLMAAPLAEEKRNYIEKVSARYIPLNHARLPGFVVNNFFWDFWHWFVYDPDTLSQALAQAGFTAIAPVGSGQSRHPELTGLERHGDSVGADLDRFETMIFEASKSGALGAGG